MTAIDPKRTLQAMSIRAHVSSLACAALTAGCCFGPSGSYREIGGSVDPIKGYALLPVKEYKTEAGRSIHSFDCGRHTVGQPAVIGEVEVPLSFCKEARPDDYRNRDREESFVFEVQGRREAFKGYCFAFSVPGTATVKYAVRLSTEYVR